MTILYNIGIRLYYLLILIASAFNGKAKLWIKGRKAWGHKLNSKIIAGSNYAWFHASSLGEFEQGRPIIEALKQQQPELKVVLTFFSPSGYEVRKNYAHADIISYLPLDTRKNARTFIDLVKPKYAFFIKYEFWYHHLKQSALKGCKTYLISGIFRKEQLFFKPYGGWYRKNLERFNHLFVQNEGSLALLNSIGIKQASLSGDTRFDRVKQIACAKKSIEIAQKFSENALVIVCGSTWEPDEAILIPYLNTCPGHIKMIFAPHEIKPEKICSITNKLEVKYSLFSQAKLNDIADSRALIIDNIGMLSSLYQYGKIAFIGGGFGAGIHNTVEAAVFSIPVLFGPNYKKFREAIALIEQGGGYSINNAIELQERLDCLVGNEKTLESAGQKAGIYVEQNAGATAKILQHISDK